MSTVARWLQSLDEFIEDAVYKIQSMGNAPDPKILGDLVVRLSGLRILRQTLLGLPAPVAAPDADEDANQAVQPQPPQQQPAVPANANLPPRQVVRLCEELIINDDDDDRARKRDLNHEVEALLAAGQRIGAPQQPRTAADEAAATKYISDNITSRRKAEFGDEIAKNVRSYVENANRLGYDINNNEVRDAIDSIVVAFTSMSYTPQFGLYKGDVRGLLNSETAKNLNKY